LEAHGNGRRRVEGLGVAVEPEGGVVFAGQDPAREHVVPLLRRKSASLLEDIAGLEAEELLADQGALGLTIGDVRRVGVGEGSREQKGGDYHGSSAIRRGKGELGNVAAPNSFVNNADGCVYATARPVFLTKRAAAVRSRTPGFRDS